jgi:hypothetical protein
MEKFKDKEKDLINEALENIREDRSLTYELINELRGDLVANKVTHKEVGFTAAKYMETLQRSNEQLVKIISITRKEKNTLDSLDISEEETQELFDIIKDK